MPSQYFRSKISYSSVIGNYLVWLSLFVVLAAVSIIQLLMFTFAEEIEQGVLRIEVEVSGGARKGFYSGTGFLINGDGVVVTNYHVVQGADSILLQYLDGDQPTQTDAQILWFSHDQDLAVLKARETVLPRPLKIADISIDELSKQDNVVAIGFPAAAETIGNDIIGRDAPSLSKAVTLLDPTVSTGTIQRFVKSVSRQMIQHSANVNSGNSGGPLIDGCGRVIGVNTLSKTASIGGKDLVDTLLGRTQNLNFQTPGSLEFAVHSKEVIAALKREEISFQSSGGYCRFGLTGEEQISFGLTGSLSLLSLVMFGVSYRRNPKMLGQSFSDLADEVTPETPVAGTVVRPTIATSIAPNILLKDTLGGAELFLRNGDEAVALDTVLVGRSSGQCDIVIDDNSISRLHAEFKFNANRTFTVTDLASTNGVSVNGAPLAPHVATTLAVNDIVLIGHRKYVFYVEDIDQPNNFSSENTASSGVEEWRLSGFYPNGNLIEFTFEISQNALNSDFETDLCKIGRSADNDFVIDDNSVSRAHAVISLAGLAGLSVRDLQSSNGTYVDGKKVLEKTVAISAATTLTFGEIEVSLSRLM